MFWWLLVALIRFYFVYKLQLAPPSSESRFFSKSKFIRKNKESKSFGPQKQFRAYKSLKVRRTAGHVRLFLLLYNKKGFQTMELVNCIYVEPILVVQCNGLGIEWVWFEYGNQCTDYRVVGHPPAGVGGCQSKSIIIMFNLIFTHWFK